MTITSLRPEHEPLRRAVSALRPGILPDGAVVDVWRSGVSGDDELLTIDVSHRIDVWGEDEWLVSTARVNLRALERSIRVNERAWVAAFTAALRDAADALFACRKHDDCRGCLDIGKACLAQRRSGARGVNMRCAG